MEVWQVVLVFGSVVIVFDAIWSFIARAKGYSYSKGIWGSILIYAAAGGMAMQSGNFKDGFLAGMGVAAIDATIGWWISSIIGPGRLPDTISKQARPRMIIQTIILVTISGAIFGGLGALVVHLI